jgi:transcriptional regulator with XRE-family HTH domain
MNIIEIGQKVAQKRVSLGLSQERLAKLSDLSRSTIHHLEHGTLHEIGAAKLFKLLSLLDIRLKTEDEISKSHALEMASRSASVSYRTTISPQELADSLITGEIKKEKIAHISSLIDELPLALIVLLVKEISEKYNIAPKKIWNHIYSWAAEIKSPRTVWQ